MDENPAVIQVLNDYYAAFSNLHVEAFLTYFHEPSLLIGSQGVFAAPTFADLTKAFSPAVESLRARGFGRSELRVRDVKSLSATTTLVTGFAIRYRVDGQEMERVGVTYVLQKVDASWKVAVLILHDVSEDSVT